MQPWLARIYVRVLSFMVARYAPDNADEEFDEEHGDRSAKPAAESIAAASTMSFHAAELSGSGKAPRSPADIRSVLEAVQRGQAPRTPDGPLARGLSLDDAILITDFRHRADARQLRKRLAADSVNAEIITSGNRFQVYVPFRDLEKAKPIVASHAAAVRKASRYRRQADAAFWASAGFTFGCAAAIVAALVIPAFIYSSPPDWGMAALLALSIGGPVGACLGITLGMFLES